MSKDIILNSDTDNDFGFSFVDEDSLTSEQDLIDLQNRLKELRSMFLPLLENLNKNTDKDMIKWPNRKQLLDKHIKRLKELTNI